MHFHWRHVSFVGLCLLLWVTAGSSCAQDNRLDTSLAQHIAARNFSWWIESGDHDSVDVYLRPVLDKQDALRDSTITLSSSEHFFAAVRHHFQIKEFETGPKPLRIDFQKVVYGKRIVYDVRREYEQRFAREENGPCRKSFFLAYNPLSLVGRVFSYEKEEFILSSCTPVSGHRTVKTLDLKTGEVSPLQRWVEDASLVEALRNDQWIQQQLQERTSNKKNYQSQLDSTQTLRQILTLLEAGLQIDPKEALRRYAFLKYDASRDRVAVRLVLDSGSEPSRAGGYVQLGLWLRPNADFRAALRRANQGEGFFLRRFPNGLADS